MRDRFEGDRTKLWTDVESLNSFELLKSSECPLISPRNLLKLISTSSRVLSADAVIENVDEESKAFECAKCGVASFEKRHQVVTGEWRGYKRQCKIEGSVWTEDNLKENPRSAFVEYLVLNASWRSCFGLVSVDLNCLYMPHMPGIWYERRRQTKQSHCRSASFWFWSLWTRWTRFACTFCSAAPLQAASYVLLTLSKSTETRLSRRVKRTEKNRSRTQCILAIDTNILLISLLWQNLMSLCVHCENFQPGHGDAYWIFFSVTDSHIDFKDIEAQRFVVNLDSLSRR